MAPGASAYGTSWQVRRAPGGETRVLTVTRLGSEKLGEGARLCLHFPGSIAFLKGTDVLLIKQGRVSVTIKDRMVRAHD